MSRCNSCDSQVLQRQCLKPNAVPWIFPNLPAYLSSTPTTVQRNSCSSSSARLKLENAKIQSLNKAILLGDILPNFDALKEKLSAETWFEGFLHVNKGNSVQFYYIVNDDNQNLLNCLLLSSLQKNWHCVHMYMEIFYHFTSTNIFYHQNISQKFHG